MPLRIDLPDDAASHDPQAAGRLVCNGSAWNSTRPAHCGARAWLSQSALDHLADDALPPFVERLSLVAQQIVDSMVGNEVSARGFIWKALNVSVKTIQVDNATFAFRAGKGVWLSFEGMHVEVLVDYAFHGSDVWNPLASSGQLSLSVAPGSSVSGLVELGVDDWGRPTVALPEPQVSLNLDMQTNSGGKGGIGLLVKAFQDLFFQPFQSCIQSAVEHVISVTMEKTVAEDLPGMIAGLPWLLPLDSGCLALDLSLCSITTEEDHIEVMLRGALLDVSRPSLVYPTEPLALPAKEGDKVADSMISFAMSKWVLNSGAWLFEQSHLNFLNISLRDGGIVALHNLLETVWPGLDLGLQFRVSGAPVFTLKDGDFRVDGRLKMCIRDFGSGKEILGGSVPLGASFAVGVSDEVLKIDVSRVSVPGITLDDGTCHTVRGRTCIFPFTFKGAVYQECTGTGSFLGQRYWCPTKVDEHGIFAEGSSDWGTCSATCQVVQRAVLPLINGQIENVLQTYFHAKVDLRRPLSGSDVLELGGTSTSVAEGAIRLWTRFGLNLASWLRHHFGLNASQPLASLPPRALA